MKSFVLIGLVACIASVASQCTETTVSGSAAPSGFCRGDLIFEENFENGAPAVNRKIWKHAHTLAGGGNWEFQWYIPDQYNSYLKGGSLHLHPTLTVEAMGDDFLTKGTASIPLSECTQDQWYGCNRVGSPDNIINPIRSARVDTLDTFNFKYANVEIRAKLPAGDWLWPALWMMPAHPTYGTWPASGEIDLMESRGNRHMTLNGVNIGVEQAGSTLHFGPSWDHNGYETSTATKNNPAGFHNGFHTYRLEWTSQGIRCLYDGELVLNVPVGDGFWARGGFESSGRQNPWIHASKMAPFDQEFFLIMNLATGGTNGYFPDGVQNPTPKPWPNTSGIAPRQFWEARKDWEPTWNRATDDSHFQIDYVKIWAV